MRKILVFFLFINQGLFAQDIPRNAKPGDCFIKCFEIDKPIYLKKIDCEDVRNNNFSEEEEKVKFEEIKKHQLKLKELGYDVDISGRLDLKTELAHNKYIAKIRKEERREHRRNRENKIK